MFKNSRANRSALHPANQFIVDNFIKLERQQQMRQGQSNMRYTYSNIIKSLQKYPLPILSRQQALCLENVGEKMANIIYGLIKTQYKDHVKNPNKEYEDALNSDSDGNEKSKKKKELSNQNSRSNSDISRNSSNLFSKPSNSFNSKLLSKDNKRKKDDGEDDLPNDFKDIKKTIKNSNKKKPPQDEDNLAIKKHGGQKIVTMISDDEQQPEKKSSENKLFNLLSQYIPSEAFNPPKLKNEQIINHERDFTNHIKNKFDNLNPPFLDEDDQSVQKDIPSTAKDIPIVNKDISSKNSSKKKQSKKGNQELVQKVIVLEGEGEIECVNEEYYLKDENNQMIIEDDLKEKNNIMIEEKDDDAQNFQYSLLKSFQFASKQKGKQQQNGQMKKILVDSDGETAIPSKYTSSSSKKSTETNQIGNASYLSDTEDNNKANQQQSAQQNDQGKKKRKFMPKEQTANWAILISLYCLREESKKNSASAKELKQKAKNISEEIDHQFTIKNFSQIDSIINNNLVIMIINQSGEKYYSLTSEGIELSSKLYQNFVAKSLAGIQEENSQENFTSQKQKEIKGNPGNMVDEDEEEEEQEELKEKNEQEVPQYQELLTKHQDKQQDHYLEDIGMENILELLEKYEQPQQRSRVQMNWQQSRSNADTYKISQTNTSMMSSKYNPKREDMFEENFSDRNSDYGDYISKANYSNSQVSSIINTQNGRRGVAKNTKKEKKVIEPLQPRNIFKELKDSQSENGLDEDDDIENQAIDNSLPFSSNRSIPHSLALSHKASAINKIFQEKLQLNSISKGVIKSYEICLIIDVRERTDRNERMVAFKEKLESLNVKCKVESIYLGDFLWVIDITTVDNVTETYVLDYVVERKTGDDFAASIQDHRYKEQKYRYKKSGLKHCYYLVEGDIKNNKHTNVSQSAIETAIMSTQLIEQFKVQRTRSFQESIQWLSFMHKNILQSFNKYFQNLNDDHIIKFQYSMADYQKQNKKNANLSLKEQFGHILRAITGSGPQQVQILMEIFQTPINLISHLESQRNLQERIELIIDQTKLNKTKLKAQGLDTRLIPKNLATSVAILFGEVRYPKDKIEDG